MISNSLHIIAQVSSPSIIFLTVSRQIICLFYKFSDVVFKQSAISYCFVFNLKKKSGRKSKYLQSTVEYLTE